MNLENCEVGKKCVEPEFRDQTRLDARRLGGDERMRVNFSKRDYEAIKAIAGLRYRAAPRDLQRQDAASLEASNVFL